MAVCAKWSRGQQNRLCAPFCPLPSHRSCSEAARSASFLPVWTRSCSVKRWISTIVLLEVCVLTSPLQWRTPLWSLPSEHLSHTLHYTRLHFNKSCWTVRPVPDLNHFLVALGGKRGGKHPLHTHTAPPWSFCDHLNSLCPLSACWHVFLTAPSIQ